LRKIKNQKNNFLEREKLETMTGPYSWLKIISQFKNNILEKNLLFTLSILNKTFHCGMYFYTQKLKLILPGEQHWAGS
jgi:hypothetical protein